MVRIHARQISLQATSVSGGKRRALTIDLDFLFARHLRFDRRGNHFNLSEVNNPLPPRLNRCWRLQQGKGVSQQIVTVLSQLRICGSDWLSRLTSNRRICWLTFAALRMVSRFAIQRWLTVVERAIAQARLTFRGSLPRLIFRSFSVKPSSFNPLQITPRHRLGRDHGPVGCCGNFDSSSGATVPRRHAEASLEMLQFPSTGLAAKCYRAIDLPALSSHTFRPLQSVRVALDA